MRELLLTVVLAFAFVPMAIANDIAFYVGAVPDAYDEGQMFDRSEEHTSELQSQD